MNPLTFSVHISFSSDAALRRDAALLILTECRGLRPPKSSPSSSKPPCFSLLYIICMEVSKNPTKDHLVVLVTVGTTEACSTSSLKIEFKTRASGLCLSSPLHPAHAHSAKCMQILSKNGKGKSLSTKSLMTVAKGEESHITVLLQALKKQIESVGKFPRSLTKTKGSR